MSCSHARPMMALKRDKSSTTENCTFWTTILAWTGNTMSPREVVKAPLKPDSTRLGFSRANNKNPIYLNAKIYNRLAELPKSTKIRLTSKSLIPGVRMRTSSYDYNTRLGSIGEKVIIPFIGRMPPSGKPGRIELTRSLTEAARSNLCLFHLEFYFSSMASP